MFGDMLFGNTHSVEQLVDIKKKKKVDKVLLKVIKTIRSRTGISDWIRPESDLKKDFDISDKAITSICDVLNEYYQINIEPQYTGTVKDIVQYIKCHQQTAADSIFLIDSSTLDIDENNDTTEYPDNVEPKENLEVDPEIVKSSEPSNPTEEDVPKGTEASTERTDTDDSSQEVYSVENISIPKGKYNLYPKMETLESISVAEKKIGFTFGKQTKNLFLHFNGIYYGTWEFMDLEEAIGNTYATYEADDRLKGKTIDKLFVARDGFGNYLNIDANDRVYIYQHDAMPVFVSKSKLLDNFINEDYKKYEKYKSSKNKDVVVDRGRLKETNKLGAKSVESFSMENLQTSQPSEDWGSMLNSF